MIFCGAKKKVVRLRTEQYKYESDIILEPNIKLEY